MYYLKLYRLMSSGHASGHVLSFKSKLLTLNLQSKQMAIIGRNSRPTFTTFVSSMLFRIPRWSKTCSFSPCSFSDQLLSYWVTLFMYRFLWKKYIQSHKPSQSRSLHDWCEICSRRHRSQIWMKISVSPMTSFFASGQVISTIKLAKEVNIVFWL